ncbi:MAG: peptidoglycan DD-metalloendopeptidase family protein [Acidimicrobiales bacterium]
MTLTLVVGFFGLVGLVTLAAGSQSAAAATSDPSDEAFADIPMDLLQLFVVEATRCPGLPWTVMAGISKVESNHGRYGGANIGPDGIIWPPIIGIALDGSNGTARVRDTDGGWWDGDATWDRAVGPFQFIPSSWRIFGSDADGDGVANPHDVDDAVPAMRRHLCPEGRVVDVEAAIFAYNRSWEYVEAVLQWAQSYTGALTTFGQPVAGYAFPAPADYATTAIATRPHHDYPAIDIAMPVATPVYAITNGTVTTAIANAGIYTGGGSGRCGNTVTITGTDGATYTYCHLSQVAVTVGDTVVAGQPIGLSGGQPGTPGAGNTTGPHLHLGIRVNGISVCPQPLLLAVLRGTPIPRSTAPTTGCVSGRPSIDWSAWLGSSSEASVPDFASFR